VWSLPALPDPDLPSLHKRCSLRWSKMSCRSLKNVIVAKREPAPFSPRCESPPMRREYRCVVTLELCCGVTLRHLIEREGEGL
jgi:hypothetical protein